MPTTRVLIAIPVIADSVPVPFVKSLLALDLDGLDVTIFWVEHTITAAARNVAVYKALGEDYSHVFFMDADMTFPSGCLKRLLSHNVDVVSGLYHPRRGNGQFFAFNWSPEWMPQQIHEIDMRPESPELMEVGGVPTGCCLVSCEAYRKVLSWREILSRPLLPDDGHQRNPFPIYKYEDSLPLNDFLARRAAEEGRERTSVDVDAVRAKTGYGCGEDLYASKLFVQAGVKQYIDTRLTCGHLTQTEVGHAAMY